MLDSLFQAFLHQHGLYFQRTKNLFLARWHLFVKLLSSQFHSRSLHGSVIDRFNNLSWRECGSMMTNITEILWLIGQIKLLWHSVSDKLEVVGRARSGDKGDENSSLWCFTEVSPCDDSWWVRMARFADDQDESQQKLFSNNQKYFANKTKAFASTLSPTSSSLLELVLSSKSIIDGNENKVSWFSTAPTESEWVTTLGQKSKRRRGGWGWSPKHKSNVGPTPKEKWAPLNCTERNIHNPKLTLLPDFWHIPLYSPISAGPCRRPQRRRARWGPWRWTRRCQRWSSWWWRPPPPSPPPSLTHSLWASLKHPQLSPLSCNQ